MLECLYSPASLRTLHAISSPFVSGCVNETDPFLSFKPKKMQAALMETVRAAEERGEPPLTTAIELARVARTRYQDEMPSLELGSALVSYLCSVKNSPTVWIVLEQAMASRVVSAFHVLALLTARVIQNRRAEPEAYRLYLELLDRYLFMKESLASAAFNQKIAKLVDDSLQITHTFGINTIDFGLLVVFFTLKVIMSLIDATLEDCGLQLVFADKEMNKFATNGHHVMDIDVAGNLNNISSEHRKHLQSSNSIIALEAVEKITRSSKAEVFLRFIHLNMPDKVDSLLQRLHFIERHKSTVYKYIPDNRLIENFLSNMHKAMKEQSPLSKHQLLGTLVEAGSCSRASCHISATGSSGCWIPFDIFMENSIDGKNVHAISAIKILTELTKALQVVNQASWQETFQALWISALRLIQRDRDPLEGPIPRQETRLCMLLAIVPLAILPIVKEENTHYSNNDHMHATRGKNYSSRRHGLVLSLQALGQFSALISPPPLAVAAANSAASKAATFVSNFKSGNDNLSSISNNESSIRAAGNLLHLVVEACITRELIDTSAYFWPGYVVLSTPSKEPGLVQESIWSTFMEETQPFASLKNALMVTPAPGTAELEKLYQIVLNGSEEERLAASKILCGASLTYGWNIQEHVVRIVVKLLSPPAFTETSGNGHLLSHMPMIGSILFMVARVEIVHIFSLYGMIPEVAAALMPLCEAFGSVAPQSNHRSNPLDETSCYSVFSCAFLLLLRLWKFYKPPQENCIGGRGGTVRAELTLDYLLLMRNTHMPLEDSIYNGNCGKNNNSTSDSQNSSSGQPIYIDSFPKLRAWYLQNQACVASTLSGLCNKNPVHQVANKILNMICRKMSKVGSAPVSASPNSSGSISGSPNSAGGEANQKPTLPAWEVLEAVPFVLEAVLTACSHGNLSSRDLTTGLRDLVDFLPASLATIVSYFSAEITRGVWKPVSMDGIDWPSPAANLISVESQIKKILASAGVQVPYIYASGGSAPMLPLPMAAMVSLTITFKLEKNLDYIHAVIGQALENCSSGCSWPCMPIIGALWTQKARRWHDFIVFSCSHSPFSRDKSAVQQLIKSCFLSFFGRLHGSPLSSNRGVSGLLGCSIFEKESLSIAPGFMYLRTCRTFHDSHFVSSTIVNVVLGWVNDLCKGSQIRNRSLASTAAHVREVATLGVSLLCIAGGVQMVQFLYEETLPAALMTATKRGGTEGDRTAILEGYAMAYMVILAGAFVWGVDATSLPVTFSSRRARALSVHMEFVGAAVAGEVAVGCDPTTWRCYVECFVGLMVGFVPGWVPDVRKETLWKVADGVRGWGEKELALALVMRGGVESANAVVEAVL